MVGKFSPQMKQILQIIINMSGLPGDVYYNEKQRTLSAVIPAKAGIHRIERKKNAQQIRKNNPKIKSGHRLSPVRRDWGRLARSNTVTVILEL